MDIIDAEPLQLFLILFSKLSQPMPGKGPVVSIILRVFIGKYTWRKNFAQTRAYQMYIPPLVTAYQIYNPVT